MERNNDDDNSNNDISEKSGHHPRPRKAERIDRKIVEKTRRIRMKLLCSELASLIPHHHHHLSSSSKETPLKQDQIEEATTYIKQLKERIDELKIRKEELSRVYNSSSHIYSPTSNSANNSPSINLKMQFRSRLAAFEMRDTGSGVEVVLISEKNSEKKFMLSEVITILENEGAEVVGASFTVTGDTIFHTLHAQEKLSRIGIETSRVYERLKELIN